MSLTKRDTSAQVDILAADSAFCHLAWKELSGIVGRLAPLVEDRMSESKARDGIQMRDGTMKACSRWGVFCVDGMTRWLFVRNIPKMPNGGPDGFAAVGGMVYPVENRDIVKIERADVRILRLSHWTSGVFTPPIHLPSTSPARLPMSRASWKARSSRPLRALAGVRPSAALLDVNLFDGKSYRVAEALAQLQVPYAFVSSYGPDHPETLQPVACLQKPASREALIALALRLVRV